MDFLLQQANLSIILWATTDLFLLENLLLAMIALSTVQSSAQTFIHNAVLFIDTSNNAWYNQPHWLIWTPYLSIIASNGFPFMKGVANFFCDSYQRWTYGTFSSLYFFFKDKTECEFYYLETILIYSRLDNIVSSDPFLQVSFKWN